jgi:hypothetical protein
MQTTNFKIINASQAYSIQKYIFPHEDGHTTETCGSYWIKYSKQCCVRRKPWTWENRSGFFRILDIIVNDYSDQFNVSRLLIAMVAILWININYLIRNRTWSLLTHSTVPHLLRAFYWPRHVMFRVECFTGGIISAFVVFAGVWIPQECKGKKIQ